MMGYGVLGHAPLSIHLAKYIATRGNDEEIIDI